MNKRQTRLSLIVKLLLNHTIGSQEELMGLLEANGCVVTQATLSRDLKTLRTSKVATELGGYKYEIAANGTAADEIASQAMDTMRRAAILSVAYNYPIVVIKTRNGYAGGVAYDIDDIDTEEILGTIAGADTVFVTLAPGVTAERAYELMCEILPAPIIEEARKGFLPK